MCGSDYLGTTVLYPTYLWISMGAGNGGKVSMVSTGMSRDTIGVSFISILVCVSLWALHQFEGAYLLVLSRLAVDAR